MAKMPLPGHLERGNKHEMGMDHDHDDQPGFARMR